MFCVLFEVHPRPERQDAYLGYANRLRPALERVDGFVDNVRYRSLERDGWILSLSTWRDEKALVRWRIHPEHHVMQEKGRGEVFLDYHLRIGQVTRDTRAPAGQALTEQRLDPTEVGAGTAVVLIDAARSAAHPAMTDPRALAAWPGLAPNAAGLVTSEAFEAVLTPGDLMVMTTFRDDAQAQAFEATADLAPHARLRRVRIVRDYGMFDRREAPQYYPDVPRTA